MSTISSRLKRIVEKDDKTIEVVSDDGSETSNGDFESRISRRKLLPRQVSLIGIGGAIGTGLFVSIGTKLTQGGPASLLIAFLVWSVVLIGVSNATCEMVTFLPVSGTFVHYAERYIDKSVGFAIGWVYAVLQIANVCYEITAVCMVIEYWTDKVPKAVWITILLLLYTFLNIFSVFMFGEGEFYLSIGKVILAVGLLIFTLVVMCGGNPQHEVLGFKYWKDPGAFAEYLDTGSMGKFHGFMACLIFATYLFWGPDYLSLAAPECIRPRETMPKSFNKVFGRLLVFYIGGALCVGILIPYNDATLLAAINAGSAGAAASPYVAAMTEMAIPVLPHIVNALILTSIISAGNSSLFSASRTLQRLGIEGQAPKCFATLKRGVPIYSVAFVLVFCLLAYLSVSNNSNTVLTWFLNIETAGMIIVYIGICVSYLNFRRGMEAQGISRDTLPYKAWGLPYLTYYSLAWLTLMLWIDGYTVFLKDNWDTQSFVFAYFMIAFFLVLFAGHKLIYKDPFIKPELMDFTSNIKELAEEDQYWEDHPHELNWFDKAFGYFL